MQSWSLAPYSRYGTLLGSSEVRKTSKILASDVANGSLQSQKFHLLSHWPLQAPLLRDPDFAEVCHGDRYKDEQFEDCASPDLRQSLCRIRYVKLRLVFLKPLHQVHLRIEIHAQHTIEGLPGISPVSLNWVIGLIAQLVNVGLSFTSILLGQILDAPDGRANIIQWLRILYRPSNTLEGWEWTVKCLSWELNNLW